MHIQAILSNAFKWWQAWAQTSMMKTRLLTTDRERPSKIWLLPISAACHPFLLPIFLGCSLTELLLLHTCIQLSSSLSTYSHLPLVSHFYSPTVLSPSKAPMCPWLNLKITATMTTLCLPVSPFHFLCIYTVSYSYIHLHNAYTQTIILKLHLTDYFYYIHILQFTINRALSYVISIKL